MNNDFLVTSGVIRQWFSGVTASLVKIIGESPNEWPKNRYSRQLGHMLFYFLHAFLTLSTTLGNGENGHRPHRLVAMGLSSDSRYML